MTLLFLHNDNNNIVQYTLHILYTSSSPVWVVSSTSVLTALIYTSPALVPVVSFSAAEIASSNWLESFTVFLGGDPFVGEFICCTASSTLCFMFSATFFACCIMPILVICSDARLLTSDFATALFALPSIENNLVDDFLMVSAVWFVFRTARLSKVGQYDRSFPWLSVSKTSTMVSVTRSPIWRLFSSSAQDASSVSPPSKDMDASSFIHVQTTRWAAVTRYRPPAILITVRPGGSIMFR
mmetsp:Transcript_22093/g.48069  ORF Transcript_22093/g.48069 Transcript_22093/m.48069 type:complete len:240 (+) Transcript_22093:2927-3646(+)